ncbi:hypothetical protein [Corallococcus sp. 4LFB]|uniref:hypothetical protein n=1 Tax=Corallococcus sp. 4LFB TaxID=3383249 RepID=UPI00397502D2
MGEATPAYERVDFWNLIAQRKRGVPEGWRWFSIQGKGHPAPREQCTSIVTGAVCTATFKSGPRKGELNWAKRDRSTERELAIPFPEFDAFLLEWEAETGRCHNCYGNGRAFDRVCYRCGGAGKAPTAPQPAAK